MDQAIVNVTTRTIISVNNEYKQTYNDFEGYINRANVKKKSEISGKYNISASVIFWCVFYVMHCCFIDFIVDLNEQWFPSLKMYLWEFVYSYDLYLNTFIFVDSPLLQSNLEYCNKQTKNDQMRQQKV